MKTIKLIGVFAALTFLVGMARISFGDGFTENGWNLTLRNDTETKQVAWLYYLNPDTMQWMNLYTGWVQPGAVEKLEHKYEPGSYVVSWEGKREGRFTMSAFVQYKFTAEKTVRKLTFTPSGLIHVTWNDV